MLFYVLWYFFTVHCQFQHEGHQERCNMVEFQSLSALISAIQTEKHLIQS